MSFEISSYAKGGENTFQLFECLRYWPWGHILLVIPAMPVWGLNHHRNPAVRAVN